jgi:hypothetical protein
VSNKAIIAIAAVVIGIGFGVTALLPYVLTRPVVDPALTGSSPAPIQIEPFADMEPVSAPGLARLPAPVPPAPVPNDSTSLTKAAPALGTTGGVPTAQQAGGRAKEAEALVPAAKGTAASRTVLTAAEQAAVDRGLKELEKTAAIRARPRPAPNRFALTEAEKASVERGLRELEKAGRKQ